MTDRKLVGLVTALLILTSPQSARAEITLEHLLNIDRLLSSNDIQSLYSYLQRNPRLLSGNDELSLELRNFYEAAATGNLDFDYSSGAPANSDSAPVENPSLVSALQD